MNNKENILFLTVRIASEIFSLANSTKTWWKPGRQIAVYGTALLLGGLTSS
jgi:hypothetical protein